MTLVGKAFALAAEVHQDQVDKAGAPYILHPVAVMQLATEHHLKRTDGWNLEKVQAAALLHDAIEDAEPAQRRMISDKIYALDDRVFNAVDVLTKRKADPAETYERYLERVATDWISVVVKIADLTHNLDAFRIPDSISEKDFERWDKYHRARVFLAHCDAYPR